MSLFNRNKNENSANDLQNFYTECIKEFHFEANKYDVANKGLIFIPELIPIGEQTVLSFLQDPFYMREFGDNPVTYYYFIMALSIETGMVFATKWHEDFANLHDYVGQIIEDGPADDANVLLEKHFSKEISENQGNPFFQKIFAKWMALHEPYWKLADPRQYTFRLMIAAYQLGVSMILEKYGY